MPFLIFFFRTFSSFTLSFIHQFRQGSSPFFFIAGQLRVRNLPGVSTVEPGFELGPALKWSGALLTELTGKLLPIFYKA
jgi:hypothetical protein